MDKNSFRKKCKSIRNNISLDERILFENNSLYLLFNSDLFYNAELVLCYVSIGSEFNTKKIFDHCFAFNKRIAVPYCENGNMIFRKIESFSDLINGSYNIPTAHNSCVEIDCFKNSLCITPALAVDYDFNRLGYGGGFYDKFLSKNNSVTSVVLTYPQLLFDKIPKELFDIKVSNIIYDKHILGGAFGG